MVYNKLFSNRILLQLNVCLENWKVTPPKMRVKCIQKKRVFFWKLDKKYPAPESQ